MSSKLPPDDRLDIDQMYLRFAKLMARRGTCNRSAVGAVIVQSRRPVSAGYVGAPPGMPHCTEIGCEVGSDGGCIRTIHAEANAIAWAARQGVATAGTSLYSTHMPCRKCAQLILSAGIGRVFYTTIYRDQSGAELLSEAGVELVYVSDRSSED